MQDTRLDNKPLSWIYSCEMAESFLQLTGQNFNPLWIQARAGGASWLVDSLSCVAGEQQTLQSIPLISISSFLSLYLKII